MESNDRVFSFLSLLGSLHFYAQDVIKWWDGLDGMERVLNLRILFFYSCYLILSKYSYKYKHLTTSLFLLNDKYKYTLI